MTAFENQCEKIIIYYTRWASGLHDSHHLLQLALCHYLNETTGIRSGNLSQRNPLSVDKARLSLSNFTTEDGAEITIIRGNEHGKPKIQEYPDIRFSISHSGDFWSCAFYDQEIGLDLQKYDVRKWKRIPSRFFHRDESVWMEGRGREDFCRLWAFKESYVKYTGNGLSQRLDTFCVLSADQRKLTGAPDVCQQEILFPETGYAMVVTTEKPAAFRLEELHDPPAVRSHWNLPTAGHIRESPPDC